MNDSPTDLLGVLLEVGQRVAKPFKWGNSALIQIRTVERIVGGNVYLNGSKGSWCTPERLLVVPQHYTEGAI